MAFDPRLDLPTGTGPVQKSLRVKRPYASLWGQPDQKTPQLTELVYGQRFNVHEREGDWVFGQTVPLISGSERKAYIGWMFATALSDTAPVPPSHYVSAISAPVFSRADLKSPIIHSLPLGAQLSVLDDNNGYIRVGSGHWVSSRHIRPIGQFEEDFVTVAKRYCEQPYVWGGNGARGVDCSGLIQMSLYACGLDAPRDADLQEQSLGEPVADMSVDTLRRGDLLFWAGHVGIVSAPNMLLHANATHMATVEEPLQPALARMQQQGLALRTVRRL